LLNNTSKDNKNDISETIIDRLERRLSEVKAEIIKWMFIFWVGQIAVVSGLIVYIK
jgi:hypothetical protein